MHNYEAPQIVELGSVEEFTQNRRRGNRADRRRVRPGRTS